MLKNQKNSDKISFIRNFLKNISLAQECYKRYKTKFNIIFGFNVNSFV